jgi:hypothetical protein
MNTIKGAHPAQNARPRRARRGQPSRAPQNTIARGTSASGTRFGRIAIAIPAAAPLAAAVQPGSEASSNDAAQNVAQGTSLIGQSDMKSTVGLVATKRAAIAATARPESLTPRK